VLHAFGGPARALDRLGVAAGPAGWLDRVAALRPDLDLDASGALLTDWVSDPLARCSYSAGSLLAEPGDDATLAEPVGRLHLAGEHTAGEQAGLMEGALRSGLRAAAEVLACGGGGQL
jgi:monoamine oxidase